jgi:hypothetical protein
MIGTPHSIHVDHYPHQVTTKSFIKIKKHIHQGSRLWTIINHLDLSSPIIHSDVILPQICAFASVIEEKTEHLFGLLPNYTLGNRKNSNSHIIGNLTDFYSLPELSPPRLNSLLILFPKNF